jgi:hypothetical protein
LGNGGGERKRAGKAGFTGVEEGLEAGIARAEVWKILGQFRPISNGFEKLVGKKKSRTYSRI